MPSRRPLASLRSLLLVLALTGLPALPLAAQGGGVVSGSVVDAATGAPLSGVSVQLFGSVRRAFTSPAGTFTLGEIEGEGIRLRFTLLGYAAVEQVVEPGRVVSVELMVDAVGLDPLVVLAQRTRMIGDPIGRVSTPGTAHYLGRSDLDDRPLLFDDVNSVLRRVPGVNVREEEGLGLRPNIGIRGTGTDRNTKITVMEDGVLVAPAPYAAPAAYYFPTMGRMEGIEVRKGASQVRYGPRTTGGAINLIPNQIPEQNAFSAEVGGGSFGSAKGKMAIGSAGQHWGALVETYQMTNAGFKELPGGDNTGYRLQDYQGKFRVNTRRDAPRYQSLEFRFGYVDQDSDDTYLGLTDADFGVNPLARYAASGLDNIAAEHTSFQLRHFLRPSAVFDLTTIAYRNETARNWYKLQSVLGQGLAPLLDAPEAFPEAIAVMRGGDSADDAVVVRANNRSYLSEGVQSVLGMRFASGRLAHDLEFGLRLHRDHEDRFQWDDRFRMAAGMLVMTTAGVPGAQANRLVRASSIALFVQDRIEVGAFTLTPGIRMEKVDFTDTSWGGGDLERAGLGTVRQNSAQAWIPGVGLAWALSPRLNVFGGVHRGFGPPGPGANEATRPEESWNLEIGTRFRRGTFGVEMAAFSNRYGNVLGAATGSQGTTGEGDLYNGGGVNTHGVETLLQADLSSATPIRVRVPVQLTWSYTHSEFRTSFQSAFWGNVTRGDELPYAPSHLVSGSIGVRGADWGVSLSAQGASEGRTEAGTGAVAPNRRTDAFLTWGMSADWTVPALGAVVFGGVENLTDARYVVARVPSGTRPGLPRTFQAGVRVRY